MITKASLMDGANEIQAFEYDYVDDATHGHELTKATDPQGAFVNYTYDSLGGNTATRFMDSITDKSGLTSTLAWSFTYSAAHSDDVATKVELVNAAGLRTSYERELTAYATVVENWDDSGMAPVRLDKKAIKPITGTGYLQDLDHFYSDGSSYLRWANEFAGGKMTKKTGPGGMTLAEYAYTPAGLMTRYVNRQGFGIDYEYASASAVVPTKRIHDTGVTEQFWYDGNGNLTKRHESGQHADGTQFAYTAGGVLTSVTDQFGRTATYYHDAAGRVTRTNDPDGHDEYQYYDTLGNVTKHTNLFGQDSFMEYDYNSCGACGGGGKLTKATDVLGNDTEWFYDGNGNLTKVTAPGADDTLLAYDGMNRLTKTASSGNNEERITTYDLLGRVSTQTTASGGSMSYAYDAFHRVTALTVNGETTSYTYDSYGNPSTVTDPQSRVTTYHYDAAQRVTKVSDPVGDISMAFDGHGNRTKITDSLNHDTTYAFDVTNGNRLTKVADAIGKETHYFHDAHGRQTKVGAGGSGTVDPTEYFFDGDGQLTKVRHTSSAGTHDAFYHYDNYERLTKLGDWIDNTNGLQYGYDAYSRLTKLTDYDGSHLDYGYDGLGRVTSMNDYHGNTTTYAYDASGHFTSLTAPGSKTWTYSYDGYDRLTKVDIPNGMHTAYGYDGIGRRTSIHHKDGSTVKQGFDYEFATGGNITRITHEDNAYWAYEYDDRDRLTQAERHDDTPSLLHRYTYTYDAAGNLVTKAVHDPSGPSTVTTTFGYNNANEQTSMVNGGTTVTQAYDAWGRLTSKGDGTHTATYAYRYGSKLHSVTSDMPGEGNVTYETGGDQKRRSRVAGASETWYNYTAGFDVVSTEDAADGSTGALTMTNVVRRPSAQVSATLGDLAGTTPSTGTARYYATDHLGSTRSAWNAAKTGVGAYEFTPYGGEYNHTGAALNSLAGAYTGKPWDDTAQLFHFPYRQYSPDRARWTTRDPLGMVDGPNVYLYVNSNPVVLSDPMGLHGCVDLETGENACGKNPRCPAKGPCQSTTGGGSSSGTTDCILCCKEKYNSNPLNWLKGQTRVQCCTAMCGAIGGSVGKDGAGHWAACKGAAKKPKPSDVPAK